MAAKRILGSVPGALGVALLVAMVGCSTTTPAPGETPSSTFGARAGPSRPAAAAASPDAASAAGRNPSTASHLPAFTRPHAVWVRADWADLPGWTTDRTAAAWTAFLRSCTRATPAWRPSCELARSSGPGVVASDAAARAWLQAHLQPYRVETAEGQASGLATGYFEPLVEASRMRRAGFVHPLYAPPPDLATRDPYWSRAQIDTSTAARKALRGHEIAWLRDPLDALVLHIQGSGRIAFAASAGRPAETVRLAFAAHNGQPYKSVGRWLIDQGELRPEQASWPAIRAWAQQNPKRLEEMLHANPRYVFFREEPLPDPELGPKGAQGVPLVPGRSIAVDPLSVPYGTPVWLDTTAPLSTRPLQRLVVAQDTGTAITGAVRADYFWGWGGEAEAEAGRMKQPLRMWVLWPKDMRP